MKKIVYILLLCAISMNASAQTKLTPEQHSHILGKVDKATAKMQSLQCEFTQTKSMKMLSKKMVSTGMMYFKRTDKLRCEFTSPYTYTFIMNGDKVKMKSSKKTQNIDVNRNKVFRKITDIIVSCITGEGLTNSTYFDVQMYKDNDNTYFVRLYPNKKEIKQMYKMVELYFNPELTMVSSVKMEEKNGDVTLIQMNNTKINQPIDEKLFAVN